ncbi:MAG: ferrous iron transport protein B [Candidatus Bathyarchaeia archaeon]|jgi:ferrous iron transport protein B|nr:ferrous iron transport protein B [Candidatus Bathyarchaeota archaeon A05DMB-4]MDH7595214.1 ferrous iron transport protein B [Candidatus Bathyarchaeota archaeon]
MVSSCHVGALKKKDIEEKAELTIALAGNANVGKSAIFNCLTGSHQHVGNWPGKTVERAEGSLKFKEYKIDVIDLPGIYSFSTFSLEELVSREYVALEKPDVVINVIDACALERNLFFTLQLMELQAPIIIALNQIDLAKAKGIKIDEKKLSDFLGVPVVATVGIRGVGVYELVEKAIEIAKGKLQVAPKVIEYGKEVEERVKKLTLLLDKFKFSYPSRFVALKLLEGDQEVKKEVQKKSAKIIETAEKYAKEIEQIHGESCPVVISSERYTIASRITKEVQETAVLKKTTFADKFDELATHKIFGYLLMIAVMFSVFYVIFTFGNFLSTMISNFFHIFEPKTLDIAEKIVWEGVVGGFIAAVTLVLPYVLPFYLLLTILEDSGYLPRVAFLLDNLMHKIGLHGKAIIPIILGYGCNVPACYSCRIMETQRDRLIAAFVVTFVPCTARIIVILGLVAAFVNIEWAFALLLIDLALILVMGRIAFKVIPGESMGMIMELPSLRMPSGHVVLAQTWARVKSIIYMVFPIYVAGGAVLAGMHFAGTLVPIENALVPVTVYWLGLPSVVGVLLLFGVVRKELVVVMPAILFGTTNLASIFTPVQMIVLAFVTMIYVPCVATFVMLKREFGWKTAIYITIFELAFGIFLGGLFFRILSL